MENGSRLQLVLAAVLMAIVVGGTVDLLMDDPESWLTFHVVFETLMIAGAVVMALVLWLGWWRAERSVTALQRSLAERKAERDLWRQSAEQALEGLARAMSDQFDAWQLTPAEREVALMLLKGYSHKSVAKLTDRSAQTVRQHAASVYRKSGLSGRAELSAFFLEDLILPDAERSHVRAGEEPEGD
jgi:DNA-binding CsgD family transcriptional regulator